MPDTYDINNNADNGDGDTDGSEVATHSTLGSFLHSLTDMALSIPHYFTRERTIGLFYLILLTTTRAVVAETNNIVEPEMNVKFNNDRFEEFSKICLSQEFEIGNKPPMQVGMTTQNQQALMVPMTCKNANGSNEAKAACNADYNKLRTFSSIRQDELAKVRTQAREKAQKQMGGYMEKMNSLRSVLKNQELKDFETVELQILNLFEMTLSAKLAKKNNIGNCGETAKNAAITLLKKIEYGYNLYKVDAYSNSRLNTITDHTWIVEGKNVTPCEIQNDQTKVGEMLDKWDVNVCDPWNDVAVNSKNDKTKLYSSTAKWDTIVVTPVLDFNKLCALPHEAYTLAQQQLSKIDIHIPAKKEDFKKRLERVKDSQTLFAKKDKSENNNNIETARNKMEL